VHIGSVGMLHTTALAWSFRLVVAGIYACVKQGGIQLPCLLPLQVVCTWLVAAKPSWRAVGSARAHQTLNCLPGLYVLGGGRRQGRPHCSMGKGPKVPTCHLACIGSSTLPSTLQASQGLDRPPKLDRMWQSWRPPPPADPPYCTRPPRRAGDLLPCPPSYGTGVGQHQTPTSHLL